MTNWHGLDKKEVLKILKTQESGLSHSESSLRLKKYGKNELKESGRINPFFIFLQQFNSIFILILAAAAIFSLFIQHYLDFGIVTGVILINAIMGFIQQYKAEKTIIELKNLLVPKVKVMRNGKLEEISSEFIVPGDILVLSEGEKIMADCRVIHSNTLETNEAILTGESFPQEKFSEILHDGLDIADRNNMLYMGTTIVRGSGQAVVVSTGMSTEFGKIANLVQKFKIERTPLEKKMDSFSKRIAVIVLVLASITVGIGIWRGEPIYDMFLAGTALAISVIPEGIPAVIAITLALAIKRMQKKNALIRKLPAAETLGRTTVICVDKTGTLTQEQMTVTELFSNNKRFNLENHSFLLNGKEINPKKNPDLMLLLKTGILCNNARIESEEKIFGEPTEKALIISAAKAGLLKKAQTEEEIRIKEFAFSSKRKMMSIVRGYEGELISYVKGSPEIVLRHCTKEIINGRLIPLTNERKLELISVYESMASNALRVLGFAFRKVPTKFDESIAENHLIFLGFQGMLDPPRKEVRGAIKECLNAGIKVKMLTGDSALTAKAIGDMIGLDGGVIEGHELERLSELEFRDVVREKTIFARINPELKYKIVKSLKQDDEIVAVTGDGVNDVLALKEAHIGVSMGIRGTEVAREVSDIILLDDNFDSIVDAVREGRRVYDNLKKSIKFHLAANVGELFVVMFALLLAFPLPFLPLAILWMNLITDSLPSLALSVEKEEKDIMKKSPQPKEDILTGIGSFIIIAGLLLFIESMVLFNIFYQIDLDKARTIALSTAVFSELFLVFTCRSEKNIWEIGLFSNKFVLYSVLAAFILQLVAIYTPLSLVFGFKALSIGELLISIGAGSLGLIFFETQKFIKNRKHKP